MHSDLRSVDYPGDDNCWQERPLQPGIQMEKRDYAMNFILRFSQPELTKKLFNHIQTEENQKASSKLTESAQ